MNLNLHRVSCKNICRKRFKPNTNRGLLEAQMTANVIKLERFKNARLNTMSDFIGSFL